MTSQRNMVILSAVLRGWTLAQVAGIFNITRERVKQIAIRTIKNLYPEIYKTVVANHVTGSITEARKHKNRMIPLIQFLTGDPNDIHHLFNNV